MSTDDPSLLLPADKPFVVDSNMLSMLVETRLPWTVAVIVTDLEGTVTHWNHFAEVVYGWTASEAVGTSIADLTVGPVTHDTAEAIMDRLRRGRHWTGSFEARRISAQIHDEFSQRFHLLIQRTAALAANELVPGQCRDELDELLGLQHELVGVMHGVCGALRPPLLDELGAEVALDHLVGSIENLGLSMSSSIDLEFGMVDPVVGEVVLAIAQEALSNVIAHAEATSCAVQVAIGNGVLELTVVDDGKGCANPWGFGLRLMNERARRAGGTLTIGAAPGGGTVVQVRLPMSLA